MQDQDNSRFGGHPGIEPRIELAKPDGAPGSLDGDDFATHPPLEIDVMARALRDQPSGQRVVQEPAASLRDADAFADEVSHAVFTKGGGQRFEGMDRPPLVADRADHLRRGCGRKDGVRIVERAGDRFLEEDGESRLACRHCSLAMGAWGRCHDDRVQLLGPEHLHRRGVGRRGVASRELCCPRSVGIGDGRNRDSVDAGERRAVLGRSPAGPDDAEPHADRLSSHSSHRRP